LKFKRTVNKEYSIVNIQNPLLVLADIHYTLPDNKLPLFNGLHLSINPGERLVILAGEAQGKSTLLRMLAGLISPTKGQVYLSDEQLSNPPPQPGGIGLLFRDAANHFLTPIVQEEILLSMGNVDKQDLESQVAHYLELAGLSPQTAMRSLVNLSASQQARVGVAALLASQPRLILADEPGACLDLAGEEQLAKIFQELSQSKKIAQVIFTSRMERANRFAERILFLNKGILSSTPFPKGRF
jgi:energy-coupling factor transporter ATP-binding protein EcfA2